MQEEYRVVRYTTSTAALLWHDEAGLHNHPGGGGCYSTVCSLVQFLVAVENRRELS